MPLTNGHFDDNYGNMGTNNMIILKLTMDQLQATDCFIRPPLDCLLSNRQKKTPQLTTWAIMIASSGPPRIALLVLANSSMCIVYNHTHTLTLRSWSTLKRTVLPGYWTNRDCTDEERAESLPVLTLNNNRAQGFIYTCTFMEECYNYKGYTCT